MLSNATKVRTIVFLLHFYVLKLNDNGTFVPKDAVVVRIVLLDNRCDPPDGHSQDDPDAGCGHRLLHHVFRPPSDS